MSTFNLTSQVSPNQQTNATPQSNIDQPQNYQPPPTNNYCQDCGSLIPAGMVFCPQCGSNRISPYSPEKLPRPAGVWVIGIIQIIFSLINLAIGISLGSTFLSALSSVGGGIGSIFAVLGIVFVFARILSLIFAIAFFTGRNWGRILMMIGAFIELFAFPIGTIIGIVVLWYLTRPRVVAYFKYPNRKKAYQGTV